MNNPSQVAESKVSKTIRFIGTFFKKPLLAAFMLGMTSGFPLTLILGVMTVWLSKYGISKTTIGLFTLATLPYSLKVLWAPILDKLSFGRWARAFGPRRLWLLIIVTAMAASILYLSTLNPADNLIAMGQMAVAIGFLSASLDIIIDAYRIEITEERDLAHSAGMYTWGYRLSNLIAGAGVFTIAAYSTWGLAIALLPLLALPGVITVFWVGEPSIKEGVFLSEERKSYGNNFWFKIYEAVILPFKEFILRRNWHWILLFIVLVKFGDVMAAIMTGPFLVELEYTLLEMAFANKAVGAIAAAAGGAAGIGVYWWLGTYKALLVSVIFMMVTNLGFVWLSIIGHDTTALAITIGLENFATGIGGTVMVAYFASLCNLSFTATQYALLSTLSSLARGFFGGFSGKIADSMDWTQFFLVSTALALPGLVVLMILWKKNIGHEPALQKNHG
ncbi:MAG: MFS transporter [Kordiimonadales bacterium]|nr:MAG: MFS transporter [Kordiimonadales bacterium]